MVNTMAKIGSIIYGKCPQGHDLSKIDCPLINDLDYVTSLCEKIARYFYGRSKNTRDLSINKFIIRLFPNKRR